MLLLRDKNSGTKPLRVKYATVDTQDGNQEDIMVEK